jgi:hypothetical protein
MGDMSVLRPAERASNPLIVCLSVLLVFPDAIDFTPPCLAQAKMFNGHQSTARLGRSGGATYAK